MEILEGFNVWKSKLNEKSIRFECQNQLKAKVVCLERYTKINVK